MKRIFLTFLVLFLFFNVDNVLAQKSVLNTIVLDAGHGGKDPGAPGTGRYSKSEKHLALDVVLKLGYYLEEAFPEMKIIYTRTGDTFPTLKDRTNLANNSNADLFLSIHCDSFTNSKAIGTSSHVMGLRYTEANLRVAQKENSVIFLEDNYEENYDGFDPNSPESIIAFSLSQTTYLDQSILMAQKIQDQFRERVNRVDRGVRQTPLWVTRATNMPSVLIELGFISNPTEEDFLNSENGQTYMASAIFRAIKEYKRELEISSLLNKEIKNKDLNIDSLSFKNDTLTTQKDVIFKVQIKTSTKPVIIDTIKQFKVERFIENNVYKYTIGNESTLEDAKKIRNIAREYGYKDAFVISFIGNEKTTIKKAVNHQNEMK
ncbi:MAG: N-acetylmuramoyl-L-alanine amidase family protein [Flavobacteriales bacterium]